MVNVKKGAREEQLPAAVAAAAAAHRTSENVASKAELSLWPEAFATPSRHLFPRSSRIYI